MYYMTEILGIIALIVALYVSIYIYKRMLNVGHAIIDGFTAAVEYKYKNSDLPVLVDTNAAPNNRLSNLLNVPTFPETGNTDGILSNHGSAEVWKFHAPQRLGSYAQITNNNKYPTNPDNGTCMYASMCGTLYDDRVKPRENNTPPSSDKVRIGYFDTNTANLTL